MDKQKELRQILEHLLNCEIAPMYAEELIMTLFGQKYVYPLPLKSTDKTDFA